MNHFSKSRETHPSIQLHVLVHNTWWMLLHASRHPWALTFWHFLHLKLPAGQQTFHPRVQIKSLSPYPISSSHYHLYTCFTPNPSLLPCLLSEVSGDSGPCYLAPPFILEEERGRKREAAAHYLHVPRGPLPSCLHACPSCCSAQLWLSTRP